MLEQYLKILDTLKAKKFSRLVHTIRETILEKLNSDLFSERLRAYLTDINAEGEPFTEYEGDPALVSQVKKIVNALYYGELALQVAEAVELRGNIFEWSKATDLYRLYNHALEHAYKAGHLATHLEINLIEDFGPEIAALTPLFSMFKTYTQGYRDEAWGRFTRMDRHAVPRQVGLLTGVVVDQLDPQAAEPDYEFLVPALADDIPKMLERITTFIEDLSSNVSTRAPTVDRARLDELQDHALQLLNALEGARGSSVFLPLQTLHYIHAIRHTITLTVSIFEQIGQVSDTTQDTARTKLEELKKLLTVLLGFTDKIEEQSMLNPGTLSRPITMKISRLYKVLISYTEKFVDFSEHRTLRTLEDSEFVAGRLAHSYDRAATDKKALLMLEEVRAAATEFFRILQNPQFQGRQLAILPPDTRDALARHYKLLQPYVLNSNTPANVALKGAIINGLGGLRGASVPQVLALQPVLDAQLAKLRVSHTFHLDLNADIVSSVSRNVEDLKLSPHSERESPFKIDEKTVLGEIPLDALTFEVVEGDNLLSNPQNLITAHAVVLYKFYQTQCTKLDDARQAYQEFVAILESPINDVVIDIFVDASGGDDDIADVADGAAAADDAAAVVTAAVARKRRLRNLYSVFQPYLLTPVDPEIEVENEALLGLDRSIIAALSSDRPQTMDSNTLELLRPVQEHFASLGQRLHGRHAIFEQAVRRCAHNDTQATPLVLEATPDRAFHVIKHQEFSRAVAKFRSYLSEQIPLFNDAFRAHLEMNPVANALPFPDLDEINQRLAQSSQVLVFKQVFNCLYYLENVIVALEKLNDTALHAAYTYNVIQVADNAIQAFLILQSLSKTPYLAPLVDEIKQKLLNVKATLTGLQGHYFPEPIPAQPGGVAVDSHTPLFYAVHTMVFLPAHIAALRANQDVQPDAAHTLHEYAERVTADLERILANSNSYLKLSSEVLTMYRLFRDLKGKFLELTTASHDIVFNNLDIIKDQVFTSILLELDRWEDTVGLKPGSLTQPVTAMFDAFYKGLLEPLRLESQQHILLVASVRPIERRMEAVNARLEQAAFDRDEAQEKQAILQRLLDSISSYKESVRDGLEPGLLHAYTAHLLSSFQSALPILSAENGRLSPDILPGNAGDAALDALLIARVEGAPRLANIEALTVACLNYHKGVQASQQLIVDTARGKIAHLNDLLLAQPGLKASFVDCYAAASFRKRRTLALGAQRVGMVDSRLRQEYADALEKWLQDAEAAILLQAKADSNIDSKIDQLLHAEIVKFHNQHYRDYCHLDRITGAVARLRRYVDGSPPYASMQRKRNYITTLETLCHENIECGLFKMQTDPTQSSFSEVGLLLAGKSAVILYNNEIFYADFVKKEVRKIVIDPSKQSDFDKLKLTFADAYKLANRDELILVSSVRGGRTPTISDRIENIQYYLDINKATFERTMCTGQYHGFFTLAWVQQNIAWLFELVGLYTPERKAGYHKLIEAVTTPPATARQLGMLGIFSMEQHRRGYALRGGERHADVQQPEPAVPQQPILA